MQRLIPPLLLHRSRLVCAQRQIQQPSPETELMITGNLECNKLSVLLIKALKLRVYFLFGWLILHKM